MRKAPITDRYSNWKRQLKAEAFSDSELKLLIPLNTIHQQKNDDDSLVSYEQWTAEIGKHWKKTFKYHQRKGAKVAAKSEFCTLNYKQCRCAACACIRKARTRRLTLVIIRLADAQEMVSLGAPDSTQLSDCAPRSDCQGLTKEKALARVSWACVIYESGHRIDSPITHRTH